MNKWDLASVNFTPDKTVVKVTNTSISVKNVGCKGRIRKREQCILAFDWCCNREDGWSKLEGKTEKECKYYLERI